MPRSIRLARRLMRIPWPTDGGPILFQHGFEYLQARRDDQLLELGLRINEDIDQRQVPWRRGYRLATARDCARLLLHGGSLLGGLHLGFVTGRIARPVKSRRFKFQQLLGHLHGGCRREQRGAPPVVEVGTAASGQSDGLGDHGLSLSAGYEQVEQDRASVVLAHRDELARHPTRRLGHDREPHWLDAQSVRTPRSVGTRPRPIPGWHHRHRCAAGDGTPRAASLSRRLELHDPSRCSENTKVSNCLTSPNLSMRPSGGSLQALGSGLWALGFGL